MESITKFLTVINACPSIALISRSSLSIFSAVLETYSDTISLKKIFEFRNLLLNDFNCY